MAAAAAGITMGDAACRRTSPATGQGIGVTTTRIADRRFVLISAAAGTKGDTLRRIRGLGRGTTARRITQFRMGCVSRTKVARRGGEAALSWRRTQFADLGA